MNHLVAWLSRRAWVHRRAWAHRFRPGVYYNRAMDATEIQLRDTAVVSVPFSALRREGHAVDLLYDFDGELVGVRVWADVRKRHRRAA